MNVTASIDDLLFRPLRNSPADTEFVLSLRNSPEFSPWFYQRQITPEMHQRFLAQPERDSEINWIIEQDARPVGISSIYNINRSIGRAESGRIACLNPRAFPLHWVVGAHVIFEHLQLKEAYIETLESNHRIARGVERMGMVRQDHMTKSITCGGQTVNAVPYIITAAQWLGPLREKHFQRYGVPHVLSSDYSREAIA